LQISIQIDDKLHGPYTVDDVKLLLARRILLPANLAQIEGESEWRPLASIPELSQSQPLPPAASVPMGQELPPPDSVSTLLGYSLPGESIVEEPPSLPPTLSAAPASDSATPPAAKVPEVISAPITQTLYGAPPTDAPPEPREVRPLPTASPTESRKRFHQPFWRRLSWLPWVGRALGILVVGIAVFFLIRHFGHRLGAWLSRPADAAASVQTTESPRQNPPSKSGENSAVRSALQPETVKTTGAAPRPVEVQPAPSVAPASAGVTPQAPKPAEAKLAMEGTVHRLAGDYSLDGSETPFSAYDRKVIGLVQQKWIELLSTHDFVRGQKGKVILKCRLTGSGRVTDLAVDQSEVDDLLAWLCLKAVSDLAPYASLPGSLRQKVKGDVREIQFTFVY
jgi:hypothetical protein